MLKNKHIPSAKKRQLVSKRPRTTKIKHKPIVKSPHRSITTTTPPITPTLSLHPSHFPLASLPSTISDRQLHVFANFSHYSTSLHSPQSSSTAKPIHAPTTHLHTSPTTTHFTPFHKTKPQKLPNSPQTHHKRPFRTTRPTRRGAAPKASPSLDREALSRGEHVEILTFTQALKKLTPYIWPQGDTASKVRVVSALGCLFFSKILNVGVPVLFKEAIDELTNKVPSLQTAKTRVKTTAQPDGSSSDVISAAAQNGVAGEGDGNAKDIATAPVDGAGGADLKATEKWIDSFIDFLQSPEFLNISTTQLPFAILTAWGLIRILGSFTNELKNSLFTKISNTATQSIAVDLLKHLLNMDMAFHLDRNTGSISRAIDRGNKSIGMALSMVTFRIIPTIFEMALVIGVLATQCGPAFSSVALATLVTYIAFTVGVTQWRTKFKQDMNKASNQASAVAFDALMNVDTVQKFNNQNLEADKYSESWEKYGHAQIKNEASLAFLNWGQSAIFSVGLTGVMLLAAQGVQDGSLSVGDLVMVNALLLQLSLPLNIVGTVYRELKQAVLDMQTMFAIRQTKSQIVNAPQPIDFNERAKLLGQHQQENFDEIAQQTGTLDRIQPLSPESQSQSQSDLIDTITSTKLSNAHLPPPTGGFSLELRNIAFNYSANKDKNIIEDISVTVPAGKSLAFVGGSGSGKSTVLKLASRQFDVTKGEILIDNVPIKDIELSSLRNTIGIVPQETTLFNDTIMYNIRYAKPSASDEEVINAAKLAQIHNSIAQMKDGYNTLVGERGLKISGGEKQRIAIARLMLLNPPIVFCDEATSALDSTTEYEIMANLRNITQNKTCVYIAHRLSTITHCDTIVVIDKGRVIEKGSHRQLLEIQDGVYQKMWKLQSTVDHHHPQAEAAIIAHTADIINSAGAPLDIKM